MPAGGRQGLSALMATAIPPVWINAHRFGTRVLRRGEEPWAAPEQLGLFLNELQRWLALELIDIDIEPALRNRTGDQVLASADDVVDLLGDSALHAALQEGLASVLGGSPGRPVALSLPGTGRLLRVLTGAEADGEDALDDVAVALTGLTRQIYANDLSALLVREDDLRALDFYAPLANVARHYQAPLLLAFDGEARERVDGFAQVYERSGRDGCYVPPEAWSVAPPMDEPVYAEIPDAMTPDAVLAWLKQLRAH